MVQKKLRWAIVGLGRHAGTMADAIQSAGQQFVAVVGREEHAAAFLSNDVRSFRTLAEAIEGTSFDAACITSPNYRHTQEALECLRAGKHVLLEKPMALSMRNARAIASAVDKNDATLAVDFHLRQHPAVQRARQLIASGVLGKLACIDMRWSIGAPGGVLPSLPKDMQWRDDPKLAGGGALMARGVHLFDLLRFLTGKEVVEIDALSDATETTVDRTAVGLLRLDNDCPVTIATSKQMLGARNGIEIAGTKGSLRLDMFGNETHSLCLIDASGTKEEHYPAGNLYASVFTSFALQLQSKKNAGATLVDGLASVAITEAFQRSARTRQSVGVRTGSR